MILLVDDDEDIRKNAGLILSLEGYNVITASDGQEALELLKPGKSLPDLIVSDIAMPRVDGYALFQAVRQIPALRLIPFIFLTAHGSRRHIRYGRELGVDDYLVKPFDPVDLLNAVRNKLNRAEEYRQVAAEEFDGARRSLVQLLSHELRTPLTYITGGFELLADSIAQNSNDVTVSMGLIRSGTHRLTRLAEQVVRYAELVSGHARIQLEQLGDLFHPADLLEGALGIARRDTEERKATLQTSVDLPQDVYVYGVSDLLIGALYEVIRNAIVYSPEGSNIQVASYLEPPHVVFEVHDPGRGIPLNDQSIVWDIMSQSERPKHEQQGAGMGLPIVHQVMQLHDGVAELRSVPNEGTTVWLKLPLADPTESHRPG